MERKLRGTCCHILGRGTWVSEPGGGGEEEEGDSFFGGDMDSCLRWDWRCL